MARAWNCGREKKDCGRKMDSWERRGVGEITENCGNEKRV